MILRISSQLPLTFDRKTLMDPFKAQSCTAGLCLRSLFQCKIGLVAHLRYPDREEAFGCNPIFPRE